MAENKKSFVLYSDSKGLVNQLPDDVAGRLLKHIYAYVNDENPVSDELLLNIAFEPIKQQLKRDLVKWENQLTQRKDAGRKSAEIRKRNSTVVDESKISSTVSVSVNDNVNVSVNDKSKEEEPQQLLAFLISEKQLELGAMACKTTLAAFTEYATGKAAFLIATTDGKYSKQALSRIIVQDFEKVRNEFELKTKPKTDADSW